ncbi:serpentine type 7TM GPCR chemoreceptor srv domain-containing protein [Ditylenchus destructor]|uniref:Serpentine type 7TM GPCR chemoreceptor srv domain-containing protein n=1 Tax=Ditylenchus destructor TaxID=166010 RepID=A0AAD4N258_9BILA|nr:serpentine type 7TM GPCR chemoreceptor srv domain-containing protein [Ditylenchus destructor]
MRIYRESTTKKSGCGNAAVSAIIFLLICGIINICTLLAYANQKSKNDAVNSLRKEEQKIELRLTIYAFLTFLAQLWMAIFMIIMSISASRPILFLATFNQLPWLNDLCTVAMPSWLLLRASQPVRHFIKKWLKTLLLLLKRTPKVSGTLPATTRRCSSNANLSFVPRPHLKVTRA